MGAATAPVEATVEGAHGRVRVDTARPGPDLLGALDDEVGRLARTGEIGAISLLITAPHGERPQEVLHGDARRQLAGVLARLGGAEPAILTGVAGDAAAWELSLLLAGDVRLCSRDATLALGPTDPPATGLASQLRRRGVDPGNLLRWPDRLDADTARDLGLVHESPADVATRMDTLAADLTDRVGAEGARAIRSSLRASGRLPHREAVTFDAWL